MLGLIRAEFRRLAKSRSLIVCTIIAIGFGVAMALIYNYFLEEQGKNIALSYAYMERFGMDTSALDTALESVPRDNLWSYINVFFSDSAIWLISSACACTFLSTEYEMGTLKNSVSRGGKRWKIYFSKLISGLADVLIISVAYVGAGGITASFLVNGESTVAAGDIALILLTYFLLLAALTGFYLMLTVIFRKGGFSVAAALAGPMLISTVLGIVTSLNENIAEISRYILIQTFMTVESAVLSGEAYIPIITALAYIAVTSVIGCTVFSRSEVK